jgi:hypothetical protein
VRRALALLLLVVSLGAFAAPSGPPDLTWPDGSKYWGAMLFKKPHGRGYLAWPNGQVYEGDFVNGAFHGQGFLHLPGGDEYRGGFAQGLFEGQGTMRYAKPQHDGRIQDSGLWHRGRFDDVADRARSALNLETALYNQRSLLDKALAAIEPARKDRINLYLLAVAGDGSQEVFRREVEFVRGQFDRDFGTRGRSLALVNSRNTVDTVPMATVTSIRESIRTIASRMDRDNDILFLFMTSHGGRDHEFKLNQNAMGLRGLRPQELARMLEEARIRWKVVLVSACYSGGFVEPLKSESTMVITAARADRTSFGCADENDFTYFGRAFFKEALPKSDSFFDAFTRAQALVGEWEKKDKTPEAERSLPQIHSPAALSQQLRKWWAQPR